MACASTDTYCADFPVTAEALATHRYKNLAFVGFIGRTSTAILLAFYRRQAGGCHRVVTLVLVGGPLEAGGCRH
jgi:hypothetical protein